MNDSPLFSIVLSTYSRGNYIKPTIESVLRQTLSDFELIVVGDGCNDDTEQVVRSFRSKKISWRNLERNYGSQSFPNNEGIRNSRGRWICYLGHDDIWAPDHLARLREVLESDNAPDFVVSGCIYYGPTGSDVYSVTGLFESSETAFRHFFPPSSLAHRRDVSKRIGNWRDPSSIAAPVDCEFLLRAAHAGLRFASTGKITVHKFAAGHRYLFYLRQSAREQLAMLDSFDQNDDGRIEHIVETTKRLGHFMSMQYPDFSKYEVGHFFHEYRKIKGLNLPALRPLTGRVIIEQSDGARALDWHGLEQGSRPFRWSGPNPRPKILIPYTGRWARITICVALQPPKYKQHLILSRLPSAALVWSKRLMAQIFAASSPSLNDISAPMNSPLGNVSVFVEDRKVEYAIRAEASQMSSLVFCARLNRSDYTVLTLHTPVMFCPDDYYGNGDKRKLGLAIADIIIDPLPWRD
jgi:glycosyltransferase involved in cell wall biosynthesis